MTLVGWLQIGLMFTAVALVVKPLGLYMAHVFNGERPSGRASPVRSRAPH